MAHEASHIAQDAGHEDRFLHRVEMLSDGVYAIAITLLALEIRTPEGWDGTVGGYFRLAGLRLIAYAVAFMAIAAYWMSHRRSFASLQRMDGGLAVLNFLQLGFIGLIPAASAALWEHGSVGAMQIYLGVVGLIGLSQGVAYAYACARGLVDPSVRPAMRLFAIFNMTFLPTASTALTFYSAYGRTPLGWIAFVLLTAGVAVVSRRLKVGAVPPPAEAEPADPPAARAA